jgi:RimJ/RimL family protein N-acetyltransferase
MPLEIRSRRLRLRRLTEADLPALLWLVADPGFHAAVEEMGSSEPEVRRYLEERAGYTDFELGKVFDLAVELLDGPVIGLVTLVRRLADQGEIGYALHADHRSRGYATEAAEALIEHLFETLDFHRVYIWLRSGNERSADVARRLGFRLEGTMMEAADMAEPRDDLLHFGLLGREWKERRR